MCIRDSIDASLCNTGRHAAHPCTRLVERLHCDAKALSFLTDEVRCRDPAAVSYTHLDQVLKALQDKKGYTETQAYNLLFSGGLEIHTTQDPDIQSVVDTEISNPENYDVVYYSIDYRLSIQHADQTTTNYSCLLYTSLSAN